MPQIPTLRRLPLPRAVIGFLGGLALAAFVGLVSMFAPQHAAAAQHVLGLPNGGAPVVAAGAVGRLACSIAGESDALHANASSGALLRSSAATAPEAAVSSTPFESQHPETPVEAPDSGIGSIEAGDDLNDFDDFAYQLRVVFDGTAQLNREVERGVSLGGRALSRLEDNRGDKPPRG